MDDTAKRLDWHLGQAYRLDQIKRRHDLAVKHLRNHFGNQAVRAEAVRRVAALQPVIDAGRRCHISHVTLDLLKAALSPEASAPRSRAA